MNVMLMRDNVYGVLTYKNKADVMLEFFFQLLVYCFSFTTSRIHFYRMHNISIRTLLLCSGHSAFGLPVPQLGRQPHFQANPLAHGPVGHHVGQLNLHNPQHLASMKQLHQLQLLTQQLSTAASGANSATVGGGTGNTNSNNRSNNGSSYGGGSSSKVKENRSVSRFTARGNVERGGEEQTENGNGDEGKIAFGLLFCKSCCSSSYI